MSAPSCDGHIGGTSADINHHRHFLVGGGDSGDVGCGVLVLGGVLLRDRDDFCHGVLIACAAGGTDDDDLFVLHDDISFDPLSGTERDDLGVCGESEEQKKDKTREYACCECVMCGYNMMHCLAISVQR